ncbi:class I SAM-dependent methyltransferase [Lentibacillus sp. Marseille-P4043]|uniref:class I SAM-dependent methyltransferase n=1 Tax=Lentibacillus sp. Marseille-P4043 TaxID=2040293 RepID=UPI000D0B7831|nr:class I SAM-dependent methyltransferase [Lentibacillus sp. Marseille-P4043]
MKNYTYHDFLAFLGVGGAHPGGIALTKKLLRDVPINQTCNILDAGCGTGQTAAYLAQAYGCKVTGLDLHPLMIEKAQKRFAKENITVRLVEGDIENSSLLAESFDLIIAESVTVFTNITKTANEYLRLLRKGGILLDLEMTAGKSFSKEEIEGFRDVYGVDEVPLQDEWKAMFRSVGFRSVEVVKENTVEEMLHDQSFQEDSSSSPEINPSKPMDPSLYKIWDKHQLLAERFSNQLKYSVYKAMK